MLLKKLKQKIESKGASRYLFWKTLVKIKDFLWRIKSIFSRAKKNRAVIDFQVGPDYYRSTNYNSKERFCSYWHQIQEILLLDAKNVLEIGIGNRFLSKYLKEGEIKVTTLDIDRRTAPDIIGSVLDIPLANNSFEIVACYEVLEHLPFENFDKGLSEMFRVSKKYAVLSVPDANNFLRLDISIPKIIEIKTLIPLPTLFKKSALLTNNKQHYWEIGRAEYPLNKIIKGIRKVGFRIKKTYRVFETPYHRFFVLEK